MANQYDIAIVGAGIVGLATARALTERAPGKRLVILEKEDAIGTHQTGHNSGVIHSGIYYKPGSYKARLTVEGKNLMYAFCEQHEIKVERCGKIIVATSEEELPRLSMIYERGQANGVPCELIEGDRLRELEPNANALRAVHSPSTGIIDYKDVLAAMRRELEARGVVIETQAGVQQIAHTRDGVVVVTPRIIVQARHLVNCAGLHSDRVARLAGATPDVQIIPFRGEYYMIRPERRSLVRTLIYPVPDPEFPFLGVHLTNTIHGELEAGPNAVFAFAREGYGWDRVNLGDLKDTFRFPGFWAMARKYWKMGGFEMYRSLSKAAFVRALQRLVPAIEADDLEAGGAGVRAQAVSPDGSLVDDFRIVTDRDAIHVLNAPSPAATASLAIGRHIAGLASETFRLA